MDIDQYIHILNTLKEQKVSFVQATLVMVRGSAPQSIGAKILIDQKGQFYGTIGGGKLEKYVLDESVKMLKGKKSCHQLQRLNLQRDIQMTCGGEVDVFFEPCFFSQLPIYLYGAGHVAQSLVPLLLTIPAFHIRVYDSRKEWLSRFSDHGRLELIAQSAPRAEEWGSVPELSLHLCITKGHGTDLPILKDILSCSQDFSFVGLIGSKVKAVKVRNELKTMGIDEDKIEQLVCPLGHAIGNNTPPEIAFSIGAQLLAFKDQLYANSKWH